MYLTKTVPGGDHWLFRVGLLGGLVELYRDRSNGGSDHDTVNLRTVT